MYRRDASIILVIYDISKKDTFIHTEYWINETKDLKGEDVIIVLVGNKIDLEDKRIVQKKEAEQFANEKGLLSYEVSAKSGDYVQELFQNKIFPEMGKKFHIRDKDGEEENVENNEQNAGGVKLNQNNQPPKKKGGCCGGGGKKKNRQVES